MSDWEIFACFIPILAMYIWQANRIDKLERKLSELESEFHETSDQTRRGHMLNAIEKVLAEDEDAREIHGVHPYREPK